MKMRGAQEWSTLVRPLGIEGIELYRGLCASSYPRYVLDDYKLGVMPRGGQYHLYRGRREFAPPGSLLVVQPGEVVSGYATDETGFAYRILAVEPRLLSDAAAALGLHQPDGPDFPQGIVDDHALAAWFVRLHGALETEDDDGSAVPTLERQDRVATFFTALIARCAATEPVTPRPSAAHPAVKRARQHLEEHYAGSISLDDLARVSGMENMFRLARLFTRDVGVPPHAFQLQTRMTRAKELLASGAEIVDVAIATGFGDQSHFTRHFTRRVGVPPGAYRRAHRGA
jgi:AraC-like DNA-binding protein